MLPFVPLWALRSASLLAKCGLVALLLYGLYLPACDDYATAQHEFRVLTARVNRKSALLGRILPDLQFKIDLLHDLIGQAELRIPTLRRRDDIMVLVARTVAASGVNQESGVMWREGPPPKPGFTRFHRSLTLSGSFFCIAGLLRDLLDLPCAISIDDLTLAPTHRARGSGEVRAEISLSLYFRTEDGEFVGPP